MRHASILRSVCALLPALVALPACAQTTTQNTTIAGEALARDVAVLAADSMEGRGAGTEGGARARRYLLRRFREVGLQPAGEDFELPFPLRADSGEASGSTGINIAGVVRGSAEPDRWIVVSAHYDHLGTRDGQARSVGVGVADHPCNLARRDTRQAVRTASGQQLVEHYT